MNELHLCRHCQKNRPNRPRGLCWSCYYTPGVLEQYPSTSKFARRGIDGNDNNRGNRPLPKPCRAIPGSEAKVAVLEERARRGLSLFHPADRPLTLDDTFQAGERLFVGKVRESAGKPRISRPRLPPGVLDDAILAALDNAGISLRPAEIASWVSTRLERQVSRSSVHAGLDRLVRQRLVTREGKCWRKGRSGISLAS